MENLASMADQLEAARAEVKRLYTLSIEQGERAILAEGERDAARASTLRFTETARAAAENWMSACRQRDEARAEVEATHADLTAAIDAMPLGALRGAAPWVVQLVGAALKMCPTVDTSKEMP